MARIKGQNLVVLFRSPSGGEWKAVAFATDCELDVNVSMLEKGSQEHGYEKEFTPGEASWRITASHLLSSATQPVDLDTLLMNRTQMQVTFTCVAGHDDPMSDPPQYQPEFRMRAPYGYAYTRTGLAYVSRHTVTARDRNYVTSSIELTGTGALLSGPQDLHDFNNDFGPAVNPDFNV